MKKLTLLLMFISQSAFAKSVEIKSLGTADLAGFGPSKFYKILSLAETEIEAIELLERSCSDLKKGDENLSEKIDIQDSWDKLDDGAENSGAQGLCWIYK